MTIGFAGAWFTSFGRLDLTEVAPGRFEGGYAHKGGRLEGTRAGALLRGRWIEGDRSGPCELTLDPGDNIFRGGWSYDGEEGFHGRWDGVRLALPSMEEGGMPGAGNSLAEGPLLSGPMVGECGETDAFVWAQARDTSPLTLVVRRGEGDPIRVTATPSWDEWLVVIFHVEGLTPGARCTYTIEGDHGVTAPQRFTTAPAPGERRARIVFGSCFYAWSEDHQPIFETIRRAAPDLFLMIGDNCYYDEPDWQSRHTMMLAQLRNRNSAPLRRVLAEVPALGIWDDHDFGPNDSDGTFAGREDALDVFRRVWAQRGYGIDGAPGIFSAVRWGPVEIFLTDDRWYRRERRQILGEAQLSWLFERLAASDAPVKLLVSGSQVLPQAAAGLDWECWTRDAPGELSRLLSFIEERDIRGVVIASGDVHLGYLLRGGGRALPGARRGADLWELTASPLANDPWTETVTGRDLYDPTVLAEHACLNFGMVDVDLDRPGAEVTLTLAGEDGRVLAARAVALDSLRCRDAGPRIAAVLRIADRAYFFTRGRYLRWDVAAGAPAPGYPRPIAPYWRGLAPGGFDAAVVWPNGRAYFFKGNGYVAYDLAGDHALDGYPKYIARYWRGLWPDGVDAAVVWNGEKAYFFKGPFYARYDIAADRVDPGYPRRIADGWPGLWEDGVDAAVVWDGEIAYFFKGRAYIAWDMVRDHAVSGPRPIRDRFPGVLGDNGVS